MKTSTTNWLLFLGFAIACGTAWHYKAEAARQRTNPAAELALEFNAPPRTPAASPPTSEAAPEAPAASPSADQPIADESSQPPAASPQGVSLPEDRERLAAARAKLKEGPSLEAIFAFEGLVFDGDRAGGTPEGDAARAELEGIAEAALATGEAYTARGKIQEARQALTTAYFASFGKEQRGAVGARLDELRDRWLRERDATGIESYTVASGDSLAAIAKRKGVSWRMVQRLNGLKGPMIRVGQSLKILTGAASLEASKERFELILLFDGVVFKRFEVAIGKDDRTPEGQFTIDKRIIEPTWYGPDGVYPYGHEKHIIGTRWLGFKNTPEVSGFGIHGTRFPESIGTAASMGCLRMRNPEVEDLFDYIPAGCPVRIR